MSFSFSLIGALAGASPLRVLGPDNPGRLAFSRAGPAFGWSAANALTMAAADTPRFTGPSRRLLVEGARANAIRNPRWEGGVAGSPGSMPTYMAGSLITDPLAGISVATSYGVEDGIPFFQVRCWGSTADGGARTIRLEPQSMPAAQNASVTGSIFARKVAGSFNGVSSPNLIVYGVPSFSDNAGASLLALTDAPLRTQRLAATRAFARADTTGAEMRLTIGFQPNTPVDLTLRFGAPQLEAGTFASSPILPAAGLPAASAREADLPLWSPDAGTFAQGTMVVQAMLPQLAPFGASQGLWQLDDGTDQNRIQLRNTSAGSAITGVVESGGVTLATLSGGNMSPGTPFRAAFAWAPGSQALCLAGGAVQTASASLPPGLARMMVGHASTQLNRAAHGEIEWVEFRPTRVSNDFLQALANAA